MPRQPGSARPGTVAGAVVAALVVAPIVRFSVLVVVWFGIHFYAYVISPFFS